MVSLLSKIRRGTRRSSTSSSSSSEQSKKSVTFCEAVKVRDTIHINDYSPEEVNAAWYSKAEINSIKENIRTSLNQMALGLFDINDDMYCPVGLEHFTKQGSQRRKRNRSEAYMAVFQEQEGQVDYGIVDEEAISLLYTCCSRHCQTIAQSVGFQIAQEVLRINRRNTSSERCDDSSSDLSDLSKPVMKTTIPASPKIVVIGQQPQRILSRKIAQAA